MPRSAEEAQAAEVLKAALALPAEARAALIGPLVDSLDTEVDADAEQAWREEIVRRLHEIDRGAAKLISWEQGAAPSANATIAVAGTPVQIHPSSMEEIEAAVQWYSKRSPKAAYLC